MWQPRSVVAVFVFVAAFASAQAGGIVPDQVDDFNGGSVLGWAEGGPSPNPPVINVGGSSDGSDYLRNTSTGTGQEGSRMIMFNSSQWSGNYANGPVRQITLEMANFGANALSMRWAIQGANGARWVSASANFVPANGSWASYVFELNEISMVRISGSGSLVDAALNVTSTRLLHSSVPSWEGGSIAGDLGVDDITASTLPVELETFTVD